VYTERLTKLIESKIEDKELVAAPSEEPMHVINLMDALKQSVAKVSAVRAPAAARKTAKKAPPAKKMAASGFIPSGKDDFRSLVIAAESEQGLRPVGKVGSGFDARLRAKLNKLLWSRVCERPIIACRERAHWVTPGLYGWVTCMERTKGGDLRAPAFIELCVD
ncbi:MAG: hypothetical protein ACREHD_29710, partial [Pirellulales bacterium]